MKWQKQNIRKEISLQTKHNSMRHHARLSVKPCRARKAFELQSESDKCVFQSIYWAYKLANMHMFLRWPCQLRLNKSIQNISHEYFPEEDIGEGESKQIHQQINNPNKTWLTNKMEKARYRWFLFFFFFKKNLDIGPQVKTTQLQILLPVYFCKQ